MKDILRVPALSCAAFCLALSLSMAPAQAKDDNNEVVRSAQIRLADLGYPVGSFDGIMGSMTENALIDFQQNNHLPMTGKLTPETFALLTHESHMGGGTALYKNYRDYYSTIDNDHQVITLPSSVWDDHWHYVQNQPLPLRFGNLNVREETTGTLRHYTVTLNGQPILLANNQPDALRASTTYNLSNEDAIIFTAYQKDDSCPNKSYLLVVHSDGSFNQPYEVGNCAGHYEAHVSNDTLFISFPGLSVADGWQTWGTWTYRNDMMVRG